MKNACKPPRYFSQHIDIKIVDYSSEKKVFECLKSWWLSLFVMAGDT
jgi:hypothetical protein